MIQQEQWQLSGSAPEVYERYLVPALFGAWAPVLVDSAALQPGERILDVACGTGVVARLARQYVGPSGAVTGLDLNPGMLAIARSCEPSIAWREGDAGALPFVDASFDVLFCQLGLQYFADRFTALREVRRVLARGERLVVLVWRSIQHSPGYAILADALEHHVSGEAAAIMRAPFALGDAERLRALIADAGFCDVTVSAALREVRFASVEDFVRYQVAGSPLAGPVSGADHNARRALIQEVSAGLQPFLKADGLAFPIEGYVATGTEA